MPAGAMKFRVSLGVAVAAAIAVSVVWPVYAHAELARSTPAVNAMLAGGPAQVELWFTEVIEPSFSDIRVLDSTGAAVDNNDTYVDPADGTHLVVSVRSLPPGVYTVVWTVLSTVDSHVTSGSFPFAVGDVSAAELAAAGQSGRQVTVSLGEVAGRWLVYLGAAMLAGGSVFVLVVWQPAYRLVLTGTPAADSHLRLSLVWRRLAAAALAALIVGSVLALLTKAGQASGSELAAPWTRATANLLFNTRYGLLWVVRFVLSLVLVGLLLNVTAKWQRWVAAGIAAALLLTVSLGSHAAGEPQPVLPLLGDWAHMAAASVWVGGLTHFAAGLWVAWRLPPDERIRLVARLIPRFSILALVSVALLGGTGLYLAWLRVGSLDSLWGTVYGRTLLIKTAIALPMVLFGASNLLLVSPRVRRQAELPEGGPGFTKWFDRSVRSEVVLGALLLLSVGLLTSIPPARAASSPSGLNYSSQVDGLQLDLNIAPGRVGVNTFTLRVRAGGRAVAGANEVALRFTPARAGLPPSEALLVEQGDGRYALQGAFLSLPDSWQVQAVVRREGEFDTFSNFDVVLETGEASPGAFPWHIPVGLLLAVSGLAGLFAARGLSRALRQPKLYWRGAGLAASVIVASLFVLYYPDQPGGLPVNPVPPNAASIAAGQALYQTNCLPCHGETGNGNGPVGLTLNPRPADLTVHTAPGVHPDGRLYEWISNGFPGSSVMPAFRKFLTDEERWHLVNYIRTLNIPQ
jgi:copper transport protein